MDKSRRSILKGMAALFTVPVVAKIPAPYLPDKGGMVILQEAVDKATKVSNSEIRRLMLLHAKPLELSLYLHRDDRLRYAAMMCGEQATKTREQVAFEVLKK